MLLYPSNTFTAWSLHCVWPLISPPSLRVDSTPTATLCIIPPLNQTVFVTNTGVRSSCEIGRKDLIFVLFKEKKNLHRKSARSAVHTKYPLQSLPYFPWPPPTHLINASLRHRSSSKALDFMLFYHYACSHPSLSSITRIPSLVNLVVGEV